jgi:LPXTG-motif cell wall-anchored protein
VAANAASAEVTGPSKKAAIVPCWKVLTNDAFFDNKVDGIYPVAAYGEALGHLPTDTRSYSTLADVIDEARAGALRQIGRGVKPDPSRCGYPLPKKRAAGGTLTSAGTGTTGSSSSGTPIGGNGTGGNSSGGSSSSDNGPIPGLIDKVGSESATSFPIALIVIAAIAGLLLLGGGAGFIVRRRQRDQAELDAANGGSQSGLGSGHPELEP